VSENSNPSTSQTAVNEWGAGWTGSGLGSGAAAGFGTATGIATSIGDGDAAVAGSLGWAVDAGLVAGSSGCKSGTTGQGR